MSERGRKPLVGEPVLDRAVRLLDSFDAGEAGQSLSDLARRSGLPTSTALRLARRMVGLGLLERLDDGRFALGIRLLELASRAPRVSALRSTALPYLEELHRATGHYVLMGVRSGDEAVLLERLSPRGPSDRMYPVGQRMPLAATGLGLALLAFAPRDYQAEYLETPRMIEPEGVSFDPVALRSRLAQIRTEGVATVSRRIGPRYASIGCPVFGADGTPLAAVSIVAPPDALVPQSMRTAVVAIAGVISRQLGGPGGLSPA